MNIAYIRVSAKDQNTGRQLEAMKDHNIELTFEEKASGKDTNRPELQAMLSYVRKSDVIYIESFSRLARNMLDLLTIIHQLAEKEVGFVSLKESVDTTTPAGRLQLHILGAIYEFERECIKQRQREGIDLALKEGRSYGRHKIEIDESFIAAYNQWRNKEITAVDAMKQAGMTRCTWYNRVKEFEAN
jgi:DNA invertase Pin-like site-specific DNA recombinase